jgi:hypothetical protein
LRFNKSGWRYPEEYTCDPFLVSLTFNARNCLSKYGPFCRCIHFGFQSSLLLSNPKSENPAVLLKEVTELLESQSTKVSQYFKCFTGVSTNSGHQLQFQKPSSLALWNSFGTLQGSWDYVFGWICVKIYEVFLLLLPRTLTKNLLNEA